VNHTRSGREVHRILHRAAPAGGRSQRRRNRVDILGQIEAEVRRALARDLHDGVAQTLTTMVVEVENYKSEHAGQPRVVSQMDSMQESAREVLSNLRQLVYELRGEQGVGGCFVDALASHLARYEKYTGINTELTVLGGWPAKLLNPAASNLRSLILEALANASRHSGARSVSVVLEHRAGDELIVTVRDDGRGIESNYREQGLGMTGMRERAALLGGRLSIEGAPGKGTTVRASFPGAQLIATEGRTK
jgi:signal transduction histidine kinase